MARDGGPAFPSEGPVTPPLGLDRVEYFPGMTLRDYFAGQALVALINHEGAADCTVDQIASDAYFYADALLEHRARHVAPSPTEGGPQ